jgi:uncharacterized small protein (DUF1192 family)
MSEPKRYKVEELNCCFDADMIESPAGGYVEYSDYAILHSQFANSEQENALLKAEVERLTQEYSDATNHYNKLHNNLQAEVERLKSLCDNLGMGGKHTITAITEENALLKAEVERLKEGNECLDKMHEKEMARSAYLCEEVNRTTAWGRGLESDLSHARVEISFLKAEVERLRASSFVTAVPSEHYERVVKVGDAMADWMDELGSPRAVPFFQAWHAAKEGKPSV